jgi:hypothetical protein
VIEAFCPVGDQPAIAASAMARSASS